MQCYGMSTRRAVSPTALIECIREATGDPNWIAAAEVMNIPVCNRLSAKIADLRKSDPIKYWVGIAEVTGGHELGARGAPENIDKGKRPHTREFLDPVLAGETKSQKRVNAAGWSWSRPDGNRTANSEGSLKTAMPSILTRI